METVIKSYASKEFGRIEPVINMVSENLTLVVRNWVVYYLQVLE